MNENVGGVLALVFWGVVGIWWYLRWRARRAEEKRTAEFHERINKRREKGEPPTAIDQLEMELRGARNVHIRGNIWALTANPIIAENAMDDDRGRFGERRTFTLDQEARDTLLANARRDAAEALLNTQAILRELHAMKKAQDELSGQLGLAGLFILAVLWFKSGTPLPDIGSWWNWSK